MKKLITILILICIFCFNKVTANPLTLETTTNLNLSNISNIVTLSNNYYFLSSNNTNTSISTYDSNFKLTSSKEFNNLINPSIIDYNGNLILIGTKSTSIKIYLLDSNLKVLLSKDTNIFINQSSTINLYNYNSKIYITLTKDNYLTNNNVYELDESLNLVENSFSNTSNIEDILSPNYYLLKYNNEDISLFKGIKYQNNYYMISNKPLLSIYNKESLISSKQDESYTSYQDITIIKDKIAILGIKNNESYLKILDDSNNIEEIKISDNLITNMYNTNNHLIFIDELNNLIIYSYNLSITSNNLPYGTLTINNTNNLSENDLVSISVLPNSGYEVDKITIYDTKGNIIPLTNNTFKMPNTDSYIEVTYKETIINPNTIDSIVIFILLFITSLVSIKYFYKKYIWLK